MSPLAARIDALFFVADHPLSLATLNRALGGEVELEDLRHAIHDLVADYERRHGGFHLVEVAGGFELRTREGFSDEVLRLFQRRPASLSDAAMETVAIVAYEQPCTRAVIDSLRGVDSSTSLRTLMERELVVIAGRSLEPGRAHVYRTTPNFLRVFGLNDLKDLPNPREIGEITEDHVLQLADYKRRTAQINLAFDAEVERSAENEKTDQ